VLPVNHYERTFVTMLVVAGALMFSYLIGSISAFAVRVWGASRGRGIKEWEGNGDELRKEQENTRKALLRGANSTYSICRFELVPNVC
jgi:hypothetical protein